MKKQRNNFLIFRPSKSAMQSGLSNTKKWCLTNIEMNETFLNSKFCWVGSTNPEKKIKIFFEELKDAKTFAKKNNLNFEVVEPNKRKVLRKSYAENFIKKK